MRILSTRRSPLSRSIVLGTGIDNGALVPLPVDLLATGLLNVGPTGSGKSRLNRHLLRQLMPDPNAATIVVSGKGSFGRDVCHDAAALGLTRRLVVVDPGDPDLVAAVGNTGTDLWFDANLQREAFRSASNLASLANTAQMSRYLLLSLAVVREQGLSLAEAAEILRPDSLLRAVLIERVQDPFLRRGLEELESLRKQPARLDQLTASTRARFDSVLADPRLRAIFAQRADGIDIARVISERKILVWDLRVSDPLSLEQVRTAGRLFLALVIAHAFGRKERHPINLVLDEGALCLTPDLCLAIDQGRELGLRSVVSLQYPQQLLGDDESHYLMRAVLNDVRSRIVWGGLHLEGLRELVDDMFVGEVDPWRVKDEIWQDRWEQVETTRTVRSRTRSGSKGAALALPETESRGATRGHDRGTQRTLSSTAGVNVTETESNSEGETAARTIALGRSEMRGAARSHMESRAWARGVSNTEAASEARSVGNTRLSGSSAGTTVTLPGGEGGVATFTTNSGEHFSAAESDARISASTHATTVSDIESESETHGTTLHDARTESRGVGWSLAETRNRAVGIARGRQSSLGLAVGESESESDSKSVSRSRGRTPSVSLQEGWSESETEQPWHEPRRYRELASRTFLSTEEQLLLALQAVKKQKRGHFVFKGPETAPVFVRAPFVDAPALTRKGIESLRVHLASLPYYRRDAAPDEESPLRLLEAQGQVRVLRRPKPRGAARDF